MSIVANPERYLSYLQQCLSNDKKPLGLFLGAGCPMGVRLADDGGTPLIPDIAGITKAVCEQLGRSDECSALLDIANSHFQNDGFTSSTIEDLLTHIRSLRAVAGNAKVRDLTAAELDRLDEAICAHVYQVVDKQLPSSETPYHYAASWTDAIPRSHPVEIFTTNYDLLMEQALEARRVPYFDGFAGVRRPFFDLRAIEEDVLPARWARLWKIHGSINWYLTKEGVFRGTAEIDGTARRVIHPSHLKYQESRRMPYLAMIDRLRAFLKQPTATLVLCGYSFRDEHINEVIVQGLRASQTAIAFALQYDRLEAYPQALALARDTSNLSILARDAAVISTEDVSWPETEAESASASRSTGLEWTPTAGGRVRAELTLGDFHMLGLFLREIVGAVRQSREYRNAE